MNRSNILLSVILTLGWHGFASTRDSLLIIELRSFIENETGFKLDKHFYTVWSRSNKPRIRLYVSSNKRVESPSNARNFDFGTDEENAIRRAIKYRNLGHHTFIYKTYATAAAELNNRFVSYSREAKCFIILHEFIHHYLRSLPIRHSLRI